jgi:hypothetical protein
MGLMRLILFFITGWILWRIIRVMMRMGATSRRNEESGIDMDTPPTPGASKTRRTIQDAEFEDLTPPPPASDKQQEKPRA